MHAVFRGLAGDRNRLVAGGADLVIGGDRQLQDPMRALVADAAKVSGMVARGLFRAKPDIDRDAGGAKSCVALASDFRIGILDRRDHARNPRSDDGIDTRRRFAEMRARLQRHVERGAARRIPGTPQRLRLGMRTPTALRPAAADNDAVPDHDRADRRIGPGAAQPAAAERQRKLHETLVGYFRLFGFLRELLFQDAEDHLRIVASRASSSLESSPSTVSKSLASRKLR